MKVDFRKSLDSYRARPGQFRVLQMPPMQYLMVDGQGDPNTAPQYADALAALYPLAYTIKFASKDQGRDYVVPPLEALWWASDLEAFTTRRDKSRWSWTAMIMVPDWIPREMFDRAVVTVQAKKAPNSLDEVRLETLDEGRCVQTLHTGAYDDEAEVLTVLHHDVIPAAGFQMTGRHHEVYLSDPRRVEAPQLRTLLRQPIAQDNGR